MSTGFLPARGTFMLDVVVVAMFAVTAAMLFSVASVRYWRRRELHRAIQTALAIALLLVIVAFEVDMRLISPGWRTLARPSPWFADGWVDRMLWIHLMFAIPTPLLWAGIIWHASKHHDQGFADPAVRVRHRISGRAGVLMMLSTAITGWIFYWMAFVS